MSLLGGPTLSIHLAEPFVFVTAPNRSAHGRNIVRPVLIRGLLVLKLPKATKITSIEVIFDGKSITKWPEGAFTMTMTRFNFLITSRQFQFAVQVLGPDDSN